MDDEEAYVDPETPSAAERVLRVLGIIAFVGSVLVMLLLTLVELAGADRPPCTPTSRHHDVSEALGLIAIAWVIYLVPGVIAALSLFIKKRATWMSGVGLVFALVCGVIAIVEIAFLSIASAC